MEFQKAVQDVFRQLSDSLEKLTAEQYYFPCKNLSGNTVGRHVRHIIEMFQCLENGYLNGEIDYEKRNRDKKIETDKMIIAGLLEEISRQITKKNKQLSLLVNYDVQGTAPETILTNYYREIAYNYEHTVHHMALIRIGIREIGDFPLDENYGVASSTIKYRQQCAQ